MLNINKGLDNIYSGISHVSSNIKTSITGQSSKLANTRMSTPATKPESGKTENKADSKKLTSKAFGPDIKETPLMKSASKVVLTKSLDKQEKAQKNSKKELDKVTKDLDKSIARQEKKQKDFTPSSKAAINLSKEIDSRDSEIDQQVEVESEAIKNLKSENDVLNSKLSVIKDLIDEYRKDEKQNANKLAELKDEYFEISANVMNNDIEIKNFESGQYGLDKKASSNDKFVQINTGSKWDENIAVLKNDIAKLKSDMSSDGIQKKIDQKEHELLGITNGNSNWTSNMWVKEKVLGLHQEIKKLEQDKNDSSMRLTHGLDSLDKLVEKQATLRKMVEIRESENSDIVANLFHEMNNLEQESYASISENANKAVDAPLSEEVNLSNSEIQQIKNNEDVLKFVSDKIAGLMQGIDVGDVENEIPDSLRPAVDYLKANDEVFKKTWDILTDKCE